MHLYPETRKAKGLKRTLKSRIIEVKRFTGKSGLKQKCTEGLNLTVVTDANTEGCKVTPPCFAIKEAVGGRLEV